jgi:hypothetical protein
MLEIANRANDVNRYEIKSYAGLWREGDKSRLREGVNRSMGVEDGWNAMTARRKQCQAGNFSELESLPTYRHK